MEPNFVQILTRKFLALSNFNTPPPETQMGRKLGFQLHNELVKVEGSRGEEGGSYLCFPWAFALLCELVH